MICSAFREDAVTYKTCEKWFQRFRNGNFDFSDRERPGQPKKIKNEQLEENPTETEKELAQALGVTHQAIFHRY